MRVARAIGATALILAGVSGASAQEPVRYRVRVTDPATRLYHVEAELPATGEVTLASLPAWTPGHYRLENYARYVRSFTARDESGSSLRWDKLDKDTWRIISRGESRVHVSFDYLAETPELSGSVLQDDFGFFNGTNLFLFPETGYDFPAEVRFDLPEGWRVATELEDAGPGVYTAADYHELVDNPAFVGQFAIDSVRVEDRWLRLAVYPASGLVEPARGMALEALAKIAATIHAMFGGPTYDRYTTLIYLRGDGGMSAGGLEHADSHLDILPAILFRSPRLSFRRFLYALFAHEQFHAWNVKRIRPAELWPYAYDREQFTPLLWVSEGITEYYADVLLVRAGLWNEDELWRAVREKITLVESETTRTSVEDASLNTWMSPTYIDPYHYYPKGALLGLLLDIKIRDATDNRHSLDDVMVRLCRDHYLAGRGFTTDDFFALVGEYLGGEAAQAFYRDYVDGREPLPYQETLALAGLDYVADTIVEPFLGVEVVPDRSRRMIVRRVVPGTAAAAAGLRAGDELLRVGAVELSGGDWSQAFRAAYADSTSAPLRLVYRRGGREYSEAVAVQVRTRQTHRLAPHPAATARQLAVRRGILEPPAGGGRD